jgi:hypothetical protein
MEEGVVMATLKIEAISGIHTENLRGVSQFLQAYSR